MPPKLVDQIVEYLAHHPYRNDAEAALWPGIGAWTGDRNLHRGNDYDRQLDMQYVYKHYLVPASTHLRMERATWRSFRHTYASLLASSGVSLYKASRWMGHGNILITDRIYAHLFDGDFENEMGKFERLLTEGPTAQGRKGLLER